MLILWLNQPVTIVSIEDTPLEIIFDDSDTQLVNAPDDLEDSKEDNDKKTDFLSNKRRRVELETRKRAQKMGTKSPLSGGAQRQAKSKARQPHQQITKTTQPNGIEYTSQAKPLKLPFSPSPSTQSMLPQYIKEQLPPGVRLGEVTSLNTNQHLFYNFHSRLLSSFVPNWGNRVGIAVRKWLQREGTPKTSKTWVTNIEVIMDSEGEVIDVQHYRLSGYWPIDEAPSKAFLKNVKRVPNPPSQMVDENGYIRLKFQTEVFWVPQAPAKRYNSDSRRKSY